MGWHNVSSNIRSNGQKGQRAQVPPVYFCSTVLVLLMPESQEIYKLHQKYGAVVRIGPNEVSIGDYRYYRPVYTDSKSVVKDPHFYAAATFVGKDNIFQMT